MKKNFLYLLKKKPQQTIFLVLFISLTIFNHKPKDAYSLESSFGLFSVEEGDDRQRPGVLAQLGIGSFKSYFYYYARSFGPVLETTSLLSLSGEYHVPIFKNLTALTGIAAMREDTEVKYSEEEDIYNAFDYRYNFGLFLGLNLTYNFWRSWFCQFGWHSAIFPAGAVGGLFLATGRKQFLLISTGYKW